MTGPGGQNLACTTKGGKARTVFIGVEGLTLLDGYKTVKAEKIGRASGMALVSGWRHHAPQSKNGNGRRGTAH